MIGYYAHHHGSGHTTRATSIAAALDEPVTVLSSRLRPAGCDVEWISLPLDIDAESPECDHTMGGVVHWAPIGVRGLTERMAMIADWIARERPRVFVVDVSVEVALFVRLLGVPVVVMAIPGERTDDPHQLAYRAATTILAPWSQDFYDPEWLHPYVHKTSYVGAISRFDGRPREARPTLPTVLVLGGAGGTSLTAADIVSAEAAQSEYRWVAAGLDDASWVADVWPLLCSATIVITHAGQNAIADCAYAGVSSVVVPQERPFGEQHATARALDAAGAAVVITHWPNPADWTAVLPRARGLKTSAWERLRPRGSAVRAAQAVTETIDR